MRADHTKVDNAFLLNLNYLKLPSRDMDTTRFTEVFKRPILAQNADETMPMFYQLNGVLFSPKHENILSWHLDSGARCANKLVECVLAGY